MKKIVVFIVSIFLLQMISLSGNFSLSEGNFVEISWTKHVIDNNIEYIFGVHTCDIDNDLDCDIIAAAEVGNEVVLYLNDGAIPISWTRLVIDDNFEGATSVTTADIDGDNDLDIIGAAWDDQMIAWWENDGDDPGSWIKHIIKTGFAFAHEVYTYDLDFDGDVDVFGASTDLSQIAWWRNDGGNRWTEQVIGSNFYGAKSMRIADFDNDGFLDVVGAAILGDEIAWWRNNGDDPIIWEKYVISDNYTGAHRVEICDMDDDGDIDVVGTAYFEKEISWWRNDGGMPINWNKQIITSNFNGACIGLPYDMDNDGDIDIVGTAQRGYDVAWWENLGGDPIVWTKYIVDPHFIGAWPGTVDDLDGDGDLDIVAGASWGDTLAWWESNLNQIPLKPDAPDGPTSGKSGDECIYKSRTTDPDNDQLFYLFDWGDNNTSDWIGPYNSGEYCEASYTWDTDGTYSVKVKAKDINDYESEWSDPLIVQMPKSYNRILEIIQKFLECHPIIYRMLQLII